MIANVRRGDTVVTGGGLIGKVTKVVDDEELEIDLAERHQVRRLRGMISEVRVKGEPVKERRELTRRRLPSRKTDTDDASLRSLEDHLPSGLVVASRAGS